MVIYEITGFLRRFTKRLKKSLSLKSVFMMAVFSIGLIFVLIPSLPQVKTGLLNLSIPVIWVLEKPVRAYKNTEIVIQRHLYFYRNQDLLNDAFKAIHTLRQTNAILRHENESLRALHAVAPKEADDVITVPCLGALINTDQKIIYLKAGLNQGIKVNQIVLSGDQIVGIIDHVGQTAARVLLLTDSESRIPCKSTISQVSGIAVGQSMNQIALKFVRDHKKLSVGEVVLSSGLGGYYPAGKVIGTVKSIDGDMIIVVPAISAHDLEFVQVRKEVIQDDTVESIG